MALVGRDRPFRRIIVWHNFTVSLDFHPLIWFENPLKSSGWRMQIGKYIFLFMFHWPGTPETAPLKDLLMYQDKWYGMLGISVADYREFMRPRSEAWGTVHLPMKDFRRLAKPFEEWL